jgi:phosphoglycolate phosphatase-like HAD superfamily hydrolase
MTDVSTPILDCVVLLDIDGTIVEGPAGRPSAGLLAMNRAAFLVTRTHLVEDAGMLDGLSDLEIAKRFRLGDPSYFAGRTDPQIARRLIELALGRAPAAGEVEALLAHYVEGLAAFIPHNPYRPLGDVPGAVSALRGAGATVVLGTGNVRPGAAAKLESAGLDGLFDLSLGGFGDDGESRAEVLEAGARSCDPSRSREVVVVGDTPRDIEAARGIGALCVGVPFHDNTAEVLARSGANAVVIRVDAGLVDVIGGLIR